jgi:hypothetical protein
MTKKHYIKLAETINNNTRYGNIRDEIKRVIDLDNFYNDLVIFLKEDNPNFNINKFWEAVNKDAIITE